MKDRIKEIRKSDSHGRTQDSFAEYLGISKSNLASYEAGRRTPSDAVIQLICQKCNIHEEWLRNGTGEIFNIPEDETAAIVSDLLEGDNPFYDIIKGIMKTYQELDDKSQSVLLEFSKELLENLKKGGD